jgi:hypothetical protein
MFMDMSSAAYWPKKWRHRPLRRYGEELFHSGNSKRYQVQSVRKEKPMKPSPDLDFDDELQPKGERRLRRLRSIGRLIAVVAVCCLAVAVIAGMGKHKRHGRYVTAKTRAPIPQLQAKAVMAQPRDPFVITAAADIDAKMVIPAPAGIDEAMVFNPYTGKRQQGQGAPVPGNPLESVPADPQGEVPEGYLPPQRPVPAQPR